MSEYGCIRQSERVKIRVVAEIADIGKPIFGLRALVKFLVTIIIGCSVSNPHICEYNQCIQRIQRLFKSQTSTVIGIEVQTAVSIQFSKSRVGQIIGLPRY